MWKKLITAVAVVLILPAIALAAEIKTGESIVVDQAQKNVYAFGTSVRTESETKGDLVAFAQSVEVSKPVENSVLAGGSNIKITGDVGNSVRIFGGFVDVDSKIAGDLIVFSGTVTISKDTEVAGDLLVFGGTVNFDGSVLGKAKINGGTVVINGRITGNVEIRADKTTITDKTIVGGKVTYWSQNDAQIAANAQIKGGVEKNEVKKTTKTGLAALATAAGWYSFLVSLIGIIILSIVLLYAKPVLTKNAVLESLKSPLNPLWKGFVAIIIAPVLIIVLLISMFGALLAVAIGAVYAVLLIIASAIAVIITGSFAMKLIKSDKNYEIGWVECVVGAIVLAIIGWIPFVGPLIKALIYLVAFGAIIEQTVKIQSGAKTK